MNDAMLLLEIGPGAGALPDTTPVPVRYGTWCPVPHQASPIPPVDGATPTPVADGVLLEWNALEQADVEYRIERAPNPSGPWTEIARVKEPRYLVSDPAGAVWHYRITPIVRGRAGAPITVEGASKQAPSVQDLVAQQTALDAEILARVQGDLQTALDAAADAQTKADAVLANATSQTDAALTQALAAADAALATATSQTDALAAEVSEIVNAPEWDADETYIAGWLVRHNGVLYRAHIETTGQAPDQHPAIWELLGQYSSVAGVAAAALEQATTTASALAAEAVRINSLVARMPAGNGQLASAASVTNESNARAAGDAANASQIQAVQSSLNGKANAAVVQSIQTRVEGLEGAGHNSNLLTNTTFNSGTRLWFKGQKNSTWTVPAVDQSGDNYHPPGIHNLGIHCPNSALADNTQWGQLYSAMVPVMPGQRYMASCYIANHRCTARLYLFWYDAEEVFIALAGSPTLARKWSGLNNLDTWHHTHASGTAPANAAGVKVIVRFHGDGGENPYGWIIRPMLEQAGEDQTAPSPWNPGGMETSAEYTLAMSVDSGHGPVVSGLRMHNDGQVSDMTILAHIFRILSPSGAADGMELQNGTLRVWRGNAQRIIGNGFGQHGDLMDYFGPNVGTDNASKSNATTWMDIHGNAYWGGDVTSGPLNYTTQTSATQTVGLELINGPFPTNGNLRTVTISFSRHVTYTKQAHGGGISLGSGSNTATIQVYRKIGSEAEELWQTLNVTGSTSFNNEYDGPSAAWASWQGSKTVVDISPSTDTVRYRAVITAFTTQIIYGSFNSVKTSQNMRIKSIEETA